MNARRQAPFFDPQNNHAAHYQRHRNGIGIKQIGFDSVVKQQTEHYRRHERHHDVAGKTPGGRVALHQPLRHHAELGAKFPHHRQDRTQLNHDLEYLTARIAETAEQIAHDNQMASTGNRQELGQTLDQPHDDCLQDKQNIHIHATRMKNAKINSKY